MYRAYSEVQTSSQASELITPVYSDYLSAIE